MSRFTIIDGSGLLFRSYYGLPALSDDYGENTHMIFGMAKMTLQILMQEPDYLAITRDVGGKTERHDMDENYKANRTQAPDDLIKQLQESHRMIAELRLPAFGYRGFEADDVINTRVQQAKNIPGIHSTIISSDKDLKQLICQDVDVYDPMKRIKTNYLQFKKKFGFEPELLADYLALIGDTADNIPGVAGIGPKGASTLIQELGTIENIYKSLNNNPKFLQRYSKKLNAGQESAFLSKQLVDLILVPEMESLDLKRDCKIEINFDIIRHVLLDIYGFQSLGKSIDKLEEKMNKPKAVGLFG